MSIFWFSYNNSLIFIIKCSQGFWIICFLAITLTFPLRHFALKSIVLYNEILATAMYKKDAQEQYDPTSLFQKHKLQVLPMFSVWNVHFFVHWVSQKARFISRKSDNSNENHQTYMVVFIYNIQYMSVVIYYMYMYVEIYTYCSTPTCRSWPLWT